MVVVALTEAERHWLLTAAANRPIWRAYREQVEQVRQRQDERAAQALRQSRGREDTGR